VLIHRLLPTMDLLQVKPPAVLLLLLQPRLQSCKSKMLEVVKVAHSKKCIILALLVAHIIMWTTH
jgi:hypothetical protein